MLRTRPGSNGSVPQTVFDAALMAEGRGKDVGRAIRKWPAGYLRAGPALTGRIQAWMIEVPWTLMLTGASGEAAGPFTTEPLTMLNLLPWHGQLIVPPDTVVTMHP